MTFLAAMDRARQADELWRLGERLYETARWAFIPAEVVKRPARDLADVLRASAVSQRHLTDSAARGRIADSLDRTPTGPIGDQDVGFAFGKDPSWNGSLHKKVLDAEVTVKPEIPADKNLIPIHHLDFTSPGEYGAGISTSSSQIR